jgi:transcription initiation factor TFIID subunit TAF12
MNSETEKVFRTDNGENKINIVEKQGLKSKTGMLALRSGNQSRNQKRKRKQMQQQQQQQQEKQQQQSQSQKQQQEQQRIDPYSMKYSRNMENKLELFEKGYHFRR